MILRAQNISLGYDKKTIINNIDIELKEGEILSITGSNGCGKSTILKALSRSIKPQNGEIYLHDKPMRSYNPKEIAQKIAYLPQAVEIPAGYTVKDIVSCGRYPYLKWHGILKPEDNKIIENSIRLMKLEDFRYREVKTLSGGEKQRVFVAMALTQKARILLLDEPTTFLDISHQFQILNIIKELNKTLGVSVIMVLHDLNQASRFSDRIITIYDGKVYKNDIPKNVITKETLGEVFKIEAKIFEDEVYNKPYFIPINSL